jgi:hypothetical protein
MIFPAPFCEFLQNLTFAAFGHTQSSPTVAADPAQAGAIDWRGRRLAATDLAVSPSGGDPTPRPVQAGFVLVPESSEVALLLERCNLVLQGGDQCGLTAGLTDPCFRAFTYLLCVLIKRLV